MTLREKVIVSAYTGYLMCDFSEVQKYVQEKMGRPVWTHEMASSNTAFHLELHEKVKPDFLEICNDPSIDFPYLVKRMYGQLLAYADGGDEDNEKTEHILSEAESVLRRVGVPC
ncbi:MAG: hypothetical protein ILM98_14050 [Kiritimatiellae bacterium]|nr:hypothetical protein [Kiritimatiellia bacterium]